MPPILFKASLNPRMSNPVSEYPVSQYVEALMASGRLGSQVCHHRLVPGAEARFAEPEKPWPDPIRTMLAASGIERL